MRVEKRLSAIQNEIRSDRHISDKYDELANLSADLRSVSYMQNCIGLFLILCHSVFSRIITLQYVFLYIQFRCMHFALYIHV